MRNRYRSYRRGIRFFPHIIPIAFPLIFPIGFILFRLLFPVALILFIVVLAVFIMEAVSQGSTRAAWNSMLNTGNQWKQRFTSPQPQPPYSQPEQPYYQPSQPYGQASQPEQPYYQPSQPYGQASQPEQPYYQPSQPYGQGYNLMGKATSHRHKLDKSSPITVRRSKFNSFDYSRT